jgi:hypothetical protein
MRTNMTKDITPEQLIKNLQEMTMTEDEKRIARAEEFGKQLGEILGSIIILLVAPTIIWAILVFIFGLQITWLKVFGGYFLFNFIKNIIARSFK